MTGPAWTSAAQTPVHACKMDGIRIASGLRAAMSSAKPRRVHNPSSCSILHSNAWVPAEAQPASLEDTIASRCVQRIHQQASGSSGRQTEARKKRLHSLHSGAVQDPEPLLSRIFVGLR